MNPCYIDSQEVTTTMVNSYAIVVPYLSSEDASTSSVEFSYEGGSPTFHLPFFFGILNSQVSDVICYLSFLVWNEKCTFSIKSRCIPTCCSIPSIIHRIG